VVIVEKGKGKNGSKGREEGEARKGRGGSERRGDERREGKGEEV